MEHTSTKRIAMIAVIGVLLISTVYFALQTFFLNKDLLAAENELVSFHQNERVINFTKLFVEKVLKADEEVDFDTRLRLENAVRDIKDEEILAQWQKFVGSKTEAAAQEEVKNLLGILVEKI